MQHTLQHAACNLLFWYFQLFSDRFQLPDIPKWVALARYLNIGLNSSVLYQEAGHGNICCSANLYQCSFSSEDEIKCVNSLNTEQSAHENNIIIPTAGGVRCCRSQDITHVRTCCNTGCLLVITGHLYYYLLLLDSLLWILVQSKETRTLWF